MSKEKQKYETEWSFSFGNLGESISNTMASLGIAEDAEVKTAHFEDPLEDAQSARVVLEPTIGRAVVSALPDDSDLLIDADLTYIGEARFEVETGETHKSVRLRQQIKNDVLKPLKDALGSFRRRDELQWIMRLTPRIPLDLRINNGVTANDFDLRGLQLTRLSINGGTGKTDLHLPVMTERAKVALNSGTGELNIDVPAWSDIDLDINNGTGKTSVVFGADTAAAAHISGGVGQCVITVPAGAAVRLHATTGLGKVSVPENFTAVNVDQFVATVGKWETPNYVSADRKIDIRYEGGIGALQIELA